MTRQAGATEDDETETTPAARKAGDHLECECPVCSRVKGLVETDEHVPHSKSGRLYVIGGEVWVCDGRWA